VFFHLDDERELVKCETIDLYFPQDTDTYIFFDKIGSIFDVLRTKKKTDTLHFLTWMTRGGVVKCGTIDLYFYKTLTKLMILSNEADANTLKPNTHSSVL
jgi:hypothetical protein